MAHKSERVSAAIQALAAQYFNKISRGAALITVTGVSLSSDRHLARVLLSVFPATHDEQALEFARRHTREMRQHIASHVKLGLLPRIVFEIDVGERNRQRLDELSQLNRQTGHVAK